RSPRQQSRQRARSLRGASRCPSCSTPERSTSSVGTKYRHSSRIPGPSPEVKDRTVGSFKVKLVAYFLLLSLLPLAVAFWGFTSVAARSETRRVDARLQAGLRAALATYQDELVAADSAAASLARNPRFQQALMHRGRATLQ